MTQCVASETDGQESQQRNRGQTQASLENSGLPRMAEYFYSLNGRLHLRGAARWCRVNVKSK